MTPGLPLGLPEQASTVKVVDGVTSVAAGPYLGDPGMAAAGYAVIEADDLDAAVAIAACFPAARLGGGIEVRPVVAYW